MSYVVGFIGDDGYLGRTFFATNNEEVLSALKILHEINKEEFVEEDWIDNSDCTGKGEFGTYFVGGLENLE